MFSKNLKVNEAKTEGLSDTQSLYFSIFQSWMKTHC